MNIGVHPMLVYYAPVCRSFSQAFRALNLFQRRIVVGAKTNINHMIKRFDTSIVKEQITGIPFFTNLVCVKDETCKRGYPSICPFVEKINTFNEIPGKHLQKRCIFVSESGNMLHDTKKKEA